MIPIAQTSFDKNEKKYVVDCINSGWVSSAGKYISKFESSFSKYVGGGYALAVSNGTHAIEIALKSLDLKKGDEVILPNLTFAATINAVINAGFKPVLVDIDPDTWTISLKKIIHAITNKSKVILTVHLYGQPSKIKEIKKIAKENNLFVIEDCAEALGSTYNKSKIGNLTDISTFSFYANKLITTGEGGIVVFKRKSHYQLAKKIINQGRSTKIYFWHDVVGSNYRMTNMQAAIGLAQLKKINLFIKIRKQIYDRYDKLLQSNDSIEYLPKNSWSTNSYWLYTIIIKNIGYKKRNLLIKYLQRKGIETRPGFYPLNIMKPFKKYSSANYKYSHYIGLNSISLPTFCGLSFKNQKYIIKNINEFLNK